MDQIRREDGTGVTTTIDGPPIATTMALSHGFVACAGCGVAVGVHRQTVHEVAAYQQENVPIALPQPITTHSPAAPRVWPSTSAWSG
jgi:hypothetical protein